ncbi:hypothetical protein Micbo1qcDRAFT_234088 [Microdochium bolleyi]|uniref:C2H2-type domain-containing protein n=1 Tax=Microdochium bolleyi TaxID=196109 RepID=A0A136J0T8_9PEZI|nr:hypothetical protein Micbo1qcDRAFT_234088 [Microdochium bolleyi]
MTQTTSSQIEAYGAMADFHESERLAPRPATTQLTGDHSPKRSSWRRLRPGKNLKLSDLALKLQYGSASVVELPPASNTSADSKVFEISGLSQVPSLKSSSDTVSLSSTSDRSNRTSEDTGRLFGTRRQRCADESPSFHVRSASEDSSRSGFGGYQDMDRLVISAVPKPEPATDHTMSDNILHSLAHPQSLVFRPKLFFDQNNHMHDNDTVTTASSRASFASTSRSSWTMSPPMSPLFGHANLPGQDGAISMANTVSDCPSRPLSLISSVADYFSGDQIESFPELATTYSAQTATASSSHNIDSQPDDKEDCLAASGPQVKTEGPEEDEAIASWQDISQDVDYCEGQKLDKIWDFAVEQFPALELASSLPLLRRRSYARHFVSQIADTIPDILMQESDSTTTEACDGAEQTPGSTVSNQGRQESESGQRKGKRKNQEEDEEDNLDDNVGGNDEDDDGPGPHKRRTRAARTEPADTYDFMCPFRLKDPQRFNVRDHKICALKVFRCNMARKEIGINELRRHIKDEHLLEGLERDPRNQCDRCKVFFKTQSDKEGHVKSGRCEYREHPTSRDPLEGIDIATRDRLVSKKGRQGQHPLKQYHGLCQIIFGDDTEELPHGHKLVREHFELHALYDEHRPKLLAKFQTLLQLGEQGMTSLGQILQDHSEGLFESCTKGVPYEVFDVAPLAGKGTPSECASSPDQDEPPEEKLGHQGQPPQATDSGIGMCNSIDGDSCEDLIKCSEEMLGLDTSLSGFAGAGGFEPHAHKQHPGYAGAGMLNEAQQLGAANVVDPGFKDTLEHRYHVNPSFLQFTDGRPWLRVKDKDNGKTLRYPIRAPVPVQISTSSTIEPPAGPAFTQGSLVDSAWFPSGEFAPDLPTNFDSFCGTNSTSSGEFIMPDGQHGSPFPAYPQPVHPHPGNHQPMEFFEGKPYPGAGENGPYGTEQGAQHHFEFAAPQDVYKMTPGVGVPGMMFQGHNTFI